MGRVLVIIGALFAIVGIGGAVASSLLAPALVSLPDRASLCRPGERLVEEGGASTATPGQGRGRTVRMFCVDDKGARREVTGDFVQGLVGQVLGNLGGVGAFITAFVFSLVFGFGLILLVIGAIMSARRTARLKPASGVMPSGTVVVRTSDGATSTNLAGATGQAIHLQQATSGDLADRLRQLGEARAANLITQAEHDRLRDEILRAMQRR